MFNITWIYRSTVSAAAPSMPDPYTGSMSQPITNDEIQEFARSTTVATQEEADAFVAAAPPACTDFVITEVP